MSHPSLSKNPSKIVHDPWEKVVDKDVHYEIQPRAVKHGEFMMLDNSPYSLIDYCCSQPGNFLKGRSSPQTPLGRAVPLVPQVSPYLGYVVSETVVIHVRYSSLVDL
jgi:hypothetical protein